MWAQGGRCLAQGPTASQRARPGDMIAFDSDTSKKGRGGRYLGVAPPVGVEGLVKNTRNGATLKWSQAAIPEGLPHPYKASLQPLEGVKQGK